MDKYLEILRTVNLFKDFSDSDIMSIIPCLDAKVVQYVRNEIVLDRNNYNHMIGIVLHGELHNNIYDYNGNESIIATFTSGDMFAESLVCADVRQPTISVQSNKSSTVMWLDYNKILTACASISDCQIKLNRNMLKIIAQKNLYLNQKLSHITKRTTKEKVIAYLNDYSVQCGNKTFEIPFDRQGLANYLSVERTALSSVLSQLRSDGILSYHKSTFTII